MTEKKQYGVEVEVIDVKGYCAAGYKPGDRFYIERFYIVPRKDSAVICLHALAGMMNIISKILYGASARELGIGDKDDEGYLQCPDPGKPYTSGGTVIFRIKRYPLNEQM